MNRFQKDILDCLNDLKGTGKFASKGTIDFVFPGLNVKNVGEISYPINEMGAQALIQAAKKAPFGKGSKTILDDKVRRTWEIDASQLAFQGKKWEPCLNTILTQVKSDLGLQNDAISAHLYKLLIYQKGDFFLPHKDSEKEKGMFGTLIIGLPSRYTGGELVVSFEETKEVIDFSANAADYKISFAAFYADCDHEIKKVSSGYRVCLVYNLIQQKAGKKIAPETVDAPAERLAAIFKKQQQARNTNPNIILLGHQYTPENFDLKRLKLNDRYKAETLLLAAKKAGYYAKLCLVTSYLAGMPEADDQYYGYGYDDEDVEDAEMAEVYDESISIEFWMKDGLPTLSTVPFEEDDLIASFNRNEDEPVAKELSGYMGNYGPDLEYWYHYGAAVVWSPEANAQLLAQQEGPCQLDWISYFLQRSEPPAAVEITAVASALSSEKVQNGFLNEELTYNILVDWMIARQDSTFFSRLSVSLCQFYFTRIDPAYWVKFSAAFSAEAVDRLFSLVTGDITPPVFEHLPAVLLALLKTGKYKTFVKAEIKKIPDYAAALHLKKNGKDTFPLTALMLRNLLDIEQKMPQQNAWITGLTEALTTPPERNAIHKVIVPSLLALKEQTAFSGRLLSACRQYLQKRADDKPQPPADWSRPVPQGNDRYKNQWQILKSFLMSPTERVFDYQRKQNERTELLNAINSTEIDLKTETIKTRSPHTLRITKTQAAYQKTLKIWQRDVELLAKIRETTG